MGVVVVGVEGWYRELRISLRLTQYGGETQTKQCQKLHIDYLGGLFGTEGITDYQIFYIIPALCDQHHEHCIPIID